LGGCIIYFYEKLHEVWDSILIIFNELVVDFFRRFIKGAQVKRLMKIPPNILTVFLLAITIPFNLISSSSALLLVTFEQIDFPGVNLNPVLFVNFQCYW